MDTQTELAKEFAAFMEWRTKAAGTTPNVYPAHGPGGIFSQPGQRAQVVNAMVMPRGLRDRLPAKRSVYANEVYPILTGQTAGTGSNPETACADCRQPGNLKVCNQTWPFSLLCLDSKVIDVTSLGLLVNRSEFVDQVLVGDPFGSLGATAPASLPFNPREALRNEKSAQLTNLFIEWKRSWGAMTYTGNPANNSGTGYAEHYGLDVIINTGYRDAYTGVACAAADSKVLSFGNLEITANAAAAVTAIVEMYAALKYLAKQVGLDPVKYALVGRYGMLRKLSEIWPCTYYTLNCSVPTGGALGLNSVDISKMRDEMRQGEYLWIDGEKVDFIIDDSITETLPIGGTAQSDLYFIPLSSPAFSHNPGGAITYFEFFDMSNAVEIAQSGVGAYPANTFQVLGGGRYLLYPKAPSNTCIQYGMKSKDRLIVEAPFLAARITGMRYTFQHHERAWNPATPYYFLNGGSYLGQTQYFYPPTSA